MHSKLLKLLNFGFEDTFIDRKGIFDYRYKTGNEYNLITHAFSVINNLVQHIMLFCQWANIPHPPTHPHISILMPLSHKNDTSFKYIFCFQNVPLNFHIRQKLIYLAEDNFILLSPLPHPMYSCYLRRFVHASSSFIRYLLPVVKKKSD